MPFEDKQWISSGIKKRFQNIDVLRHQVQNPCLIFFTSHWRMWGEKHRDTSKHGTSFESPDLMRRVMQPRWLVYRFKKICASYISSWTISTRVSDGRWWDDFVPSLWFGNIISYFLLPEGVASLRLESERGSVSHLHKAKIEPSSCPFGFLSLNHSPEEYSSFNLTSCYIWRNVMLQAGQAQCIHWLLLYSCLKTLLVVTADVLFFLLSTPNLSNRGNRENRISCT